MRRHPSWQINTETTDLFGRVIDIAMVDLDGRVLYESLINPGAPVAAEATAVHGLWDRDLVGAPTRADIADTIADLLSGRSVAGYGLGYDQAVIDAEMRRVGRAPIRCQWLDVMPTLEPGCAGTPTIPARRPPRCKCRADGWAAHIEPLATACTLFGC